MPVEQGGGGERERERERERENVRENTQGQTIIMYSIHGVYL